MKVIKEAWLLKCVDTDGFMCMQNTNTPKLYVSKASAQSAAEYHARQNNTVTIIHTPVKAFLVVEDELGEDF